MESRDSNRQPIRHRRQRPKRRQRRRRVLAGAGVIVLLLAPGIYSYATAMMQPSSLPLWPRSVEWMRAHHGNWLVDEVEHYYYTWKTPRQGRPAAHEPAACRSVHGCHRRRASSAAAGTPTAAADQARVHASVAWRRGVERHRSARGWPPAGAASRHFEPSATIRASSPTSPGLTTLEPRPRGTQDATSPPKRPIRGPMSVPYDQRWRLLATFNGGFIYTDGDNGSSINGRQYEPLKAGLATLIAYRDGSRRRGDLARRPNRRPEHRVRAPEPAADHRSRATQPRVERQHAVGLHARKRRSRVANRRRNRSPRQPDLRRRRLPDGRLRWPDPAASGRGPCDAARHQPRVANPDHLHAPRRLEPAKIVPNYQQPPTRYLVPDDRDFFAVYRRLPGPASVPFR